jgi:hypothetical protein
MSLRFATAMAGPPIGFDACAGRHGFLDKAVKTGLSKIRDLLKPDAAQSALLRLLGACDEDFTAMASPLAAVRRLVFAAKRDCAFNCLHQAIQKGSPWRHHRAPEPGEQQPRRFTGPGPELAFELKRGKTVGMARDTRQAAQNQRVSGSFEPSPGSGGRKRRIGRQSACHGAARP